MSEVKVNPEVSEIFASMVFAGRSRFGEHIYDFVVQKPDRRNIQSDYWNMLFSAVQQRVAFTKGQALRETGEAMNPGVKLRLYFNESKAPLGILDVEEDGTMVWVSRFLTSKSYARVGPSGDTQVFIEKTRRRFIADIETDLFMNNKSFGG